MKMMIRMETSICKEGTYKNSKEISFFCEDIRFLVCTEQKRKLEKF